MSEVSIIVGARRDVELDAVELLDDACFDGASLMGNSVVSMSRSTCGEWDTGISKLRINKFKRLVQPWKTMVMTLDRPPPPHTRPRKNLKFILCIHYLKF